jgi:predicted dehydrogenase
MLATVHLNYLQMPERHEYEIVGDAGWALLDANSGVLRIGNKKQNNELREHFAFERDRLYRDEHDAFLAAVAGKRQPESSPEDGLISMKIISAALHSLNTRQRVPFKAG